MKYRRFKFGTQGAQTLFWCAVGLLQWLSVGATATELRFDTAREWRQWRMPQRAVDLSPDGAIRPVRVNKNINAALNAFDFGGGIRGASSEEPAGTRLEIRSRSGHSLDAQIAFRDKDGQEVTEKRWKKLIPSFRGPIDTTLVPAGDWSPWSSSYQTSGQEFLSPSLRRYVKLDVRLVAAMPQQAAALDWVSLEFADPLAADVAGEIFPTQVEPGVENEFSYFLRTKAVQEGFDRLVVEASTPVRFVEALLDGESVAVENQGGDAGFRVQFPGPVRSGELVELRFSAAIFVDATRFDLFLENSALQEPVRQRVEAGDASGAVESSTQIVRLPLVLFTQRKFKVAHNLHVVGRLSQRRFLRGLAHET